MTTTTNLSMTLVAQSQAQKEVTVNAALTKIDAILNTGAKDKDLATPPGSPAEGDVYIVAASPTGSWSGQAGKIAYYNQSWQFITPKEGMRLWVNDENVVYAYDGAAWCAASTGSTQLGGFRNLLQNADMVIDQRNEGASQALSSDGGVKGVDRWQVKFKSSTASGVTSQRVTDAPSGYSYSVKLTVGTGASSVPSDDWMGIYHAIKGWDFKAMAFGTASARIFSISFWVKSSVTGTFSVAIENAAGTRAYTTTFTISSANTWEQKKIEGIGGDTSGTWVTTSAASFRLYIIAAAGSSAQTSTLNTWRADSYKAANTQTNTNLTTSGATFQVTGVQLEPGPVCTPFEIRPYQYELMQCQMHYCKTFSMGTAPAQNAGTTGALSIYSHVASATFGGSLYFPLTMRAAPTITTYNPSAANANWRDATNSADRTVTVGTIGQDGFAVTGASGAAAANNIIHYAAAADLS